MCSNVFFKRTMWGLPPTSAWKYLVFSKLQSFRVSFEVPDLFFFSFVLSFCISSFSFFFIFLLILLLLCFLHFVLLFCNVYLVLFSVLYLLTLSFSVFVRWFESRSCRVVSGQRLVQWRWDRDPRGAERRVLAVLGHSKWRNATKTWKKRWKNERQKKKRKDTNKKQKTFINVIRRSYFVFHKSHNHINNENNRTLLTGFNGIRESQGEQMNMERTNSVTFRLDLNYISVRNIQWDQRRDCAL